MRRSISLVLLTVVTVVAVGAAFVSQKGGDGIPGSGELVFPTLLTRINDVHEIVASSAGESFSIKRVENRWSIPGKSGYPAAENKIRQLLLGTAALRRIEPKTANPELYSKIGLERPDSKDASSIRFLIRDAAGQAVADYVAGNQKPARGDPDLSEIFIRELSDPQSWLVKGKLPSGKTLVEWMDKVILDIDRTRVRTVKVSHPDGEIVIVSKGKPSDPDFALDDLPAGAKIEEQWRLNDIGRGLAELNLDDVDTEHTEFSDEARAYTVTMHTYDGLRVTMEASKRDDDTFARLKAEFDEESLDPAFMPPTAPESDAAVGSGEGEEGAKGIDALRHAAQVREEVQRLNDRWSAWTYKLPQYKAGYFAKRRSDLIKSEVEMLGESEDSG